MSSVTGTKMEREKRLGNSLGFRGGLPSFVCTRLRASIWQPSLACTAGHRPAKPSSAHVASSEAVTRKIISRMKEGRGVQLTY